jgi:hypothetical protein
MMFLQPTSAPRCPVWVVRAIWALLLITAGCWTGQPARAPRDVAVSSPRSPSIAGVQVTCEADSCVPPVAVATIGRRRPWWIAVELRAPDSDPRLGDDPITFEIPSLRCTAEPGEHVCRISTLQAHGVAHQASFVGFTATLDEPSLSALRLRIEWSYCNDRLEERLGRVCTRDRGYVVITLGR